MAGAIRETATPSYTVLTRKLTRMVTLLQRRKPIDNFNSDRNPQRAKTKLVDAVANEVSRPAYQRCETNGKLIDYYGLKGPGNGSANGLTNRQAIGLIA